MHPLKVAVLGYGYLGKWHCQKVEACTGATLYSIVEKFPANAEAAKLAHPQAKIVDDLSEVIAEIDAAIVVTPTSTHHLLVKTLLQHNKHVFCEKPLCFTLSEAKDILSLSKNSSAVLQVGHSERFHEAWEIIEKEFSDYLKPPFTMRISRFAPFKGRATDVDVISDVMIHDLDLMVYLTKKKPLSVRATGNINKTSKWDHVLAYFEMPENSSCSILSSRNHTREIRELEIANNHGCLTVDLMTLEIGVSSKSGELNKITAIKRDHLLLEHQAFYHSILNKHAAVVNVHDGYYANLLIDQVTQSLATHQAVSFS